jgi:hypothetical protein
VLHVTAPLRPLRTGAGMRCPLHQREGDAVVRLRPSHTSAVRPAAPRHAALARTSASALTRGARELERLMLTAERGRAAGALAGRAGPLDSPISSET